MKPALIHVENLRRSFRSPKKKEGFKAALELLIRPEYSEHEALKGVSFSVEEGAFIGLIGANGAGKTTLLKILSGLIPPTSGEAKVLGLAPFSRPLAFRKQISLVMGQKAQLWWDLPALDAFHLLQAIYEIPRDVYKKRLDELANLLDVTKLLHTQIRRLSLGERMKMELIGALIHWPKIIFLDEPTIGLDVLAAQKLRDFLRDFNARNEATIILTSHNMDDIERLCSRVLILREGEMIYDGSARGLTQEGECRLRLRLKETLQVTELATLLGVAPEKVTAEETDGDDIEGNSQPSLFVSTHRSQIVGYLQKILGRTEVLDMGIEEQSLETVIQRLYKSAP